MVGLISWASFLFVFLFSSFADARPVNLHSLFYLDGMVMTEDSVSGTWKGADRWDGMLCNGGYSYTVGGRAHVEALDMEMREEGYVDAVADLRNIDAYVTGSYRSGLSFCKRISTVVDAQANRLKVNARIWFTEEGDDLVLTVRILESKLSDVHFSKYFPKWFERFLTKQIDKAMNYIWHTRLGEWIGDRVGEAMADQFPGGSRMVMAP